MPKVPKPDIYIDDISTTHHLSATQIRGLVVDLDVETFSEALDPEGRAAGWRAADCFVLSLLTEQEKKPSFQFVLTRPGLVTLAEEIASALESETE